MSEKRRSNSRGKRIKRSLSRAWRWFVNRFDDLRTAPIEWFWAIVRFIGVQLSKWRRSPSFRSFFLGLPAALVMILVGYLTIITWYSPRSSLVDRYNLRAQQAIAAGDTRYAKLCLERLVQIRGEDPNTLLQLAELYANEDNPRRVAALMQRIAPLDRATIPEAHLWQARNLLAKRQLTPEEVKVVEQQLANVLTLRRFDPAARSLLGQVYSQTGRDAEALEMYQGIVDRSPGDSLRLAEVAARLGKSAVARTSGEEALGGFQAILDRQRDSWPARQDVVRSLIFLERFEDSLQVLRETPAEVDRDLLRGALVSVYGTWTMVLQQQNAPVQRRIDIIEKTLRADPGSTLALDSIASLLQNADDAELIRIRAILNRMLVVGQSTPLVHLCLGTDAILREDFDAGIKHLRLAYQSDPNLVVAANNLAWALMQTQPPKLTEALQLVDSVVERQPELAAVRETRGQVLLRLGKVEQAIAELEYALRELPTSVVTRESLITAYRLAGMDAVAAEHELILKHINDQK